MPTKHSQDPKEVAATQEHEVNYVVSLYEGLTTSKLKELLQLWNTKSRRRIYNLLNQAGYVRKPKLKK